jgi:hypothetical protein
MVLKEVILAIRMSLQNVSTDVSAQDYDDPTNLALHADQQLRNPTARVYRVRYLGEYLGDVTDTCHPRSMRAYRYIKVICRYLKGIRDLGPLSSIGPGTPFGELPSRNNARELS